MAEPALTKEEKQWNKQLTTHIESYLSLRDWSELAAWLSKLKNQFTDKKGPVQDKNTLQTLLKRLATSLNPSLPVALHESTLEIYELLFQQGFISGTTCQNQDSNSTSHASAYSLSSPQLTQKTGRERSNSLVNTSPSSELTYR
jgi:hypothetical protein